MRLGGAEPAPPPRGRLPVETPQERSDEDSNRIRPIGGRIPFPARALIRSSRAGQIRLERGSLLLTCALHYGMISVEVMSVYKQRGTPNVTLRLSPEVRHQIEFVAREEKKTMADIIREAIKAYLKEKQNRLSGD